MIGTSDLKKGVSVEVDGTLYQMPAPATGSPEFRSRIGLG